MNPAAFLYVNEETNIQLVEQLKLELTGMRIANEEYAEFSQKKKFELELEVRPGDRKLLRFE